MLYMNDLIYSWLQLCEVRTTLHSPFTGEQTKARKLAQDYKASKWQRPVDGKAQGLTCCCILPFHALHLPEIMSAKAGHGERCSVKDVGYPWHREPYQPSMLLVTSICQPMNEMNYPQNNPYRNY